VYYYWEFFCENISSNLVTLRDLVSTLELTLRLPSITFQVPQIVPTWHEHTLQDRYLRWPIKCNQAQCAEQGDQIGPIFAHWAIVYFGRLFYYKSNTNFWLPFSIHASKKLGINFDQKWVWLHFGRIFQKTRLVTLMPRHSTYI
jgi:hypothetical protein